MNHDSSRGSLGFIRLRCFSRRLSQDLRLALFFLGLDFGLLLLATARGGEDCSGRGDLGIRLNSFAPLLARLLR
jgi:hypothetical protein